MLHEVVESNNIKCTLEKNENFNVFIVNIFWITTWLLKLLFKHSILLKLELKIVLKTNHTFLTDKKTMLSS